MNLKRDTLIWDLDGTLFDNSHRQHLIPLPEYRNRTEYWNQFNLACIEDIPIPQTHSLYQLLMANLDLQFIIITARPELCREQTVECMRLHDMEYNRLYMRADDDDRPSVEVKKDILFNRIGEPLCRILGAFENDPTVIEFYRSQGIMTYEVNPSMSL